MPQRLTLALALVVILAVPLAACGGGNAESAADSNNAAANNAVDQATEPEPADTEAEEEPVPTEQSEPTAEPENPPEISLAEYEALETGMTYEEAVEIIGGPGQEMSRSEVAGIVSVMYQWDGEGGFGANANAMFQDDALVSKAQLGLE